MLQQELKESFIRLIEVPSLSARIRLWKTKQRWWIKVKFSLVELEQLGELGDLEQRWIKVKQDVLLLVELEQLHVGEFGEIEQRWCIKVKQNVLLFFSAYPSVLLILLCCFLFHFSQQLSSDLFLGFMFCSLFLLSPLLFLLQKLLSKWFCLLQFLLLTVKGV